MKLLVFVIAALLFVGCGANQKPSSKTEESEKPLSAHGTMEKTQSAAKAGVLKGKVLERLDAGRYSYLRLSTSSGEVWAAVLLTDASIGSEVTVENPIPMDGFETKTLNRKFDRIFFGTLQQPEGVETAKALQDAHSGVSESASAEPIKVQRAAGSEGRTIAEIFAQKTQLKDRHVAVMGKVVKVNANIMGKTWIHVRDGSGDPKSRTNDLTITTQGSAAVGDTIMVKGTVHIDMNLGMGYVFPVIIEDATITKQ
jgi:hypothetical protein